MIFTTNSIPPGEFFWPRQWRAVNTTLIINNGMKKMPANESGIELKLIKTLQMCMSRWKLRVNLVNFFFSILKAFCSPS